MKELGAAACFNFRTERCHDALKRLPPEGLDGVYDNVSWDHFQAATEDSKEPLNFPCPSVSVLLSRELKTSELLLNLETPSNASQDPC